MTNHKSTQPVIDPDHSCQKMNAQFKYVKTIAEFRGFDYQSLYEGATTQDQVFRFFANPIVPLLAIALYLLNSQRGCDLIRKFFNIEPKGAVMQWTVAIHSATLAVFSGWTFYNALSIFIPYTNKYGLEGSVCDVHGDLWYNQGMGYWVTLFYLSKYYEFIDTWIIMLKGRTPIFLQTFHHAGIVILMWGFIATANSAGGVILTVFNSGIHTLMYTYYTLAAFGYSSPLKHYLTQAQMAQFGVGICLTIPMHFVKGCITPAQSLVIFVIQLYCATLMLLFYQFYVKNYTKKSTKPKKSVDDKKQH